MSNLDTNTNMNRSGNEPTIAHLLTNLHVQFGQAFLDETSNSVIHLLQEDHQMTPMQKIAWLLETLESVFSRTRLTHADLEPEDEPVIPPEGFVDSVSSTMLQLTQEVPTTVHELYTGNKYVCYNQRPLMSWACQYGLSLEVIQAIYEIDPLSPQKGTLLDSYQCVCLPIHEAIGGCAAGENIDTVAFLLECHSEPISLDKSWKLGPIYEGRIANRLFSLYPTHESIPILSKYLSPESFKEFTMSGTVGWSKGPRLPPWNPLPLEVFKLLGDVHQQDSFVIRAEKYCDLGYKVDKNQGLVVEVPFDETIFHVIGELKKIPNLYPKVLDMVAPENESHPNDPLDLFIAALNHQHQPQRAPEHVCLSFVQRLSLHSGMYNSLSDADIAGMNKFDQLLAGAFISLPNLNSLILSGDDDFPCMIDDASLQAGLQHLLPLSDRLEEIKVREFHCCPLGSVLDLMERSATLRKVYINAAAWSDIRLWNDSHAERLGDCLSVNTSVISLKLGQSLYAEALDAVPLSHVTSLAQGLAANTVLQNLTLEFPIGEHVTSLVQGLAANTVLQNLTLEFPIGESNHQALIDLVHKKRNVILQTFQCDGDEVSRGLSEKMNYWCLRNRMAAKLQEENINLARGIGLLAPFLGDHQMIFCLISSRPGLWFH